MPIDPNRATWLPEYGKFLKASLKENAKPLQIVTGLFLAGLICGGIENSTLLSFIDKVIAGLVERFQEFQGVALCLRIFINNLVAAILATAAGIVLGIFPLISAFLNGLLLGAVLFNFGEHTHWNLFQRLLGIAPHGIFELPAFFLSLALGLRLGTWPFQKEKRRFLIALFNNVSLIFFKIIIPFLLIAAAIEATGIELLR